MKRGTWLRLLLVACALVLPASGMGAEEKTGIERLMNEQVAAWNRRDFEGFMRTYWNSPELTFFGGDGVTRGWRATLDRYVKRYGGEGRDSGHLRFLDLKIDLFAPDAAWVTGRCHLQFRDGKTQQCLFTLIIRKKPEGWRIVHDHSSGIESSMTSGNDHQKDLEAIRALHDKDIAATKAYDVEALVSLWSEDIVALAPGQPPTRGQAALRKGLEEGKGTASQYEVIDYQQNWEEAQIAGDYAFEWGTFLSVFRPAGGEVTREQHNVLRVLKRHPDGSWRVHRTIWNDGPKRTE